MSSVIGFCLAKCMFLVSIGGNVWRCIDVHISVKCHCRKRSSRRAFSSSINAAIRSVRKNDEIILSVRDINVPFNLLSNKSWCR